MNKKNIKKRDNRPLLFLSMTFIIVIFLTVAYSAFSDNLGITNSVAHVRIDKVVRINGVTTDSGFATDIDFSHSSIINTVNIPAGESITYSTKVTNLGNVPVAISEATFVNPSGETIANLSSNIDSQHYVKICDNEDCTLPVSKVVDITVTNTGSTPINANLIVKFTFSEIYSVYYKVGGSTQKLGEAFKGGNFNYTFSSNAPTNLIIDGTYGTNTYENGVLNINNVQSDIQVYKAHKIIYNNIQRKLVKDGENYHNEFTSEQPKSVEIQGTYGSYSFENYVLDIQNITSDLNITGTYGEVVIKRITYISSTNVTKYPDPVTPNGLDTRFDFTFKKTTSSNEFKITYEFEIKNEHYSDFIYRNFDYTNNVTANKNNAGGSLSAVVTGISNGDILHLDDTRVFRITFVLDVNDTSATYTTTTNTDVDITKKNEEQGSIVANITPKTGDLRSPNTTARFTLNVVNTYEQAHTFEIISTNSNFKLVDENGNNLSSLTVNAQGDREIPIFVVAKDNALFLEDTATTTILLRTNGIADTSAGDISLNVDVFEGVDEDKVIVSNAKIEMVKVNNKAVTGKAIATWQRDDEGGTNVVDYYVLLYKGSTLSQTVHTGSAVTSYTFENLDDASYYVIVYGIDEAGNTGESDVGSATTAAGPATKSANATFKWRFNVTNNLSNLTSNGSSTAYLNQDYVATLSGSTSRYDPPSSASDITVTMGGKSFTGFTYDSNYGKITIPNVTGDITIKASGVRRACLIEGTKVLLANGEYKDIKNINYDDLLLVYSYETGEFVSEYPIWIEKEQKTLYYQQNYFSDGTVLNTLGYHGVYEAELNRFVSVDDPSEFHVGSKIIKLNKEKNGFDVVTVTNIETIKKTVNYYHVVSTRYYNIIANDFLTTDGTVILSNLYGFNDDMTWPKELRDKALTDVYDYSDLADAIPYYMFKGMRAEEGKILAKYGLDLNTFKGYLMANQNNPEMVKEPIKYFNNNMWMVTTSLDNVTPFNKQNYLRPEGSKYTLPSVNDKKFIGWLNTSDNKMYYPHDEVTVYHGMYFEAVYKH